MKVERRPSTLLLPLPAALVTVGAAEDANIIAIAWAGVVNSDPPMVGVSIRPSRHSYALLEETRELVVNIPRASHVRAVDLAGHISGRDGDKFAACGLTRLPGRRVGVPLIAECPVNLECLVRQQLPLGSHDLFLAEVVAVHCDEEVVDGRGRLLVERLDALVYAHGEYWTLGERVGEYGFSRRPSRD